MASMQDPLQNQEKDKGTLKQVVKINIITQYSVLIMAGLFPSFSFSMFYVFYVLASLSDRMLLQMKKKVCHLTRLLLTSSLVDFAQQPKLS